MGPCVEKKKGNTIPLQADSRVAVGEDEAVTVGPVGRLGVVVHELGPENVGDGSHALGVSLFGGCCSGAGRLTMGAPG